MTSPPRWLLTRRRYATALAIGVAVCAAACVAGVAIGDQPVDLAAVFTGGDRPEQAIAALRLRRVALAAGVGALLGLSGACFQGVLRNPLADPYVLGTAGGAAFGAVLAAAVTHDAGFWWGRLGLSLAGAFAALGLVLLAAARRGRVPVHTLILVGVVVNAFCGAAILLTVSLLEGAALSRAIHWMMGSLGIFPTLLDAYVCGGALLLALALALPAARTANLLAGGEESAAALGVEVGRARWWLLGVGGLCAGAAVGEAGPIGFVGLIVPHVVRRLAGADHRLLFPLAALGGATLLVVADIPGRTVVAPQELPVGVFMALLGAPFFLWLLRRTGEGLWARA